MLVSHQVYSLTATQCPTLRYASSVHVKPLVSSRVCLFAYSVVNDPLSLSPSIPRRLDANFPVAISQGPLDSLPVSPFGSVSCEVSSPRRRRCIPAEIHATAAPNFASQSGPQALDSILVVPLDARKANRAAYAAGRQPAGPGFACPIVDKPRAPGSLWGDCITCLTGGLFR